MFNKPLQQNTDVNVNSITGTLVFHRSVFSLAKKLNLLLNTGTVLMSGVGHVLSIQLGTITWCGLRPTTVLLFLTFSYKGNI